MKPKIPRIPHAFFKWYCSKDKYEELHGDLEEFYYERFEVKGSQKAKLRYLADVIRSCQPYAWRTKEKSQNSVINYAMLITNLKTTLRTLNRNRLYTLINVLGLSIGIICTLVIFLIIQTETNFDTFHDNGDRIYRVVSHKESSNGLATMAASFYPLAKALLNDFPELENAVVTQYSESGLISITDSISDEKHQYKENLGIGYTTSNFFQIFDFPLIRGDKVDVLSRINTVALSESAAQRYFGLNDPIGRTIILNNNLTLEVTGVYQDFPDQTEIPFSTMLISLESLKGENRMTDLDDWRTQLSSIQTFVLLPQYFDPLQLEKQLPGFAEKYFDMTKYVSFEFLLQPLSTIHSDERYVNYYQQPVSKKALNSLMLIGFFIIVTACINFINLSTAQSLKRAKGIGIRQIMGSDKSALIIHFLVETSIITLLALIVSLLATGFVLDELQNHIQFSAPVSYSIGTDLMIFIGAIFFATILISGLYPAILISKFNSLQVIKGRFKRFGNSGLSIRKSLIVLQFAISQTLVIGVIIVSQQIAFFTNHDIGFDKEHIIRIPLPEMDVNKMGLLKNELASSSLIISSSFSMATPMTEGDLSASFDYPNAGVVDADVVLKFGDVDYLKTYGIELLAGRPLRNTDSLNNLLVNESFVRKMNIINLVDAIGQEFRFGTRNRTIVGVIKDFNSENFHHSINPLLIGILPSYYFIGGVKISGNNIQESLVHIQQSWEKVFPEFVFGYEFYDESIATYYQEETRISSLFAIFSSLSIFISCIGLFGLVMFMAEQRTKEIGIRKVLGASVTNIASLFSTEFAKLIAIALLIASPLAWYIMDQWLADFVYRIEINPGTFFVAGVITLLTTVITVGYKSIGAAMANPVKALRDE